MNNINDGMSCFKIRDINVPSRFFLAPINTGFARNGEPTPDLIRFHSARSGRGIGISYVGNVAIDSESVTNSNTLFFGKNVDTWVRLVEAINSNGSLPGIQIACRRSMLQPPRRWEAQDPDAYISRMRDEISSHPETLLLEVVSKFVLAAETAYKVGFTVIQIHAGHGYFLSSLLNPVLNNRIDLYGLDKAWILKSIVYGIRSALPNVILDVRFSLLDGLDSKESEIAQKQPIIGSIASLDIDILSISNGIYDINKNLIYPPAEWGHGTYIDLALQFAVQHPDKIWNTAGNIWDLRLLPANLPKNLTFSIGRSLIADPEFVVKSIEGRQEGIQVCTRTNRCHYYSRGMQNIACPFDSHLGQFLDS
jgi:2,4-dienoyl-CoA reductase-like NADH-dependent reductase (Old Yellow Enzyme family)